MEILEYIDRSGHSPFADWFEGLNAAAAARITVALTRMAQGNFSSARGVGRWDDFKQRKKGKV